MDLLAELESVRVAIAKSRRPRLLPVVSIEATGAGEAILRLADWGPCPRVRELVEVMDAAGDRSWWRVRSTAGLLALGSSDPIVIAAPAEVQPGPRLRKLRERERELVAMLTVAVTRVRR